MKTSQQNSVQNQNLSSGQFKGSSQTSAKTSASNIQSMLGNVPEQLQEFGHTVADKVSHLSTTQKVLGGSLLALGAGWIAARQADVDLGQLTGKAKRK